MRRLPNDMRRLLDESGLPWRIENGTRHFKLMIGDKMVTIIPKAQVRSVIMGHAHRNAMAYIKRAIKEYGR